MFKGSWTEGEEDKGRRSRGSEERRRRGSSNSSYRSRGSSSGSRSSRASSGSSDYGSVRSRLSFGSISGRSRNGSSGGRGRRSRETNWPEQDGDDMELEEGEEDDEGRAGLIERGARAVQGGMMGVLNRMVGREGGGGGGGVLRT